MEYIKATYENIDCVLDIVQNTVKTIYPNYYPKEVVNFFCELHNRKNIAKDIQSGNVGVLLIDEQIGRLTSFAGRRSQAADRGWLLSADG